MSRRLPHANSYGYTMPRMKSFAGYSILRQMPPGGMTDLFLALDSSRHRVVIRCLREPYAKDRKWRKSFYKTAQVMAKFNHPHILQIYDAGHVGRQPYMAMEYIESQNLRSLLLKKDVLLTRNALPILRQMAEALCYVQRMGYLHCDFKPDNVLLRDDGTAVLIDFDLVTRYRNAPVRLKEARGTRFYMPPETLAKKTVDEQTDVYAWGVTAYEVMTFHKPFEANTLEGAHAAQTDVTTLPRPMSTYQEGIPKALERLILKCLAKRKEDRYPSMGLVLNALKALI